MLPSNWALLDARTNLEAALKIWNVEPSQIPWETGILAWATNLQKEFATPEWTAATCENRLQVDRTLQERTQRGAMQTKAEGTHTGEERWCNMDQFFVETVSSTCAVVGFFVGYAVSLAKDSKEFCQSRQGQAELSVDWEILPPLCRADNVEERNIKVAEVRERAKAERASGSGGARGSMDPPLERSLSPSSLSSAVDYDPDP